MSSPVYSVVRNSTALCAAFLMLAGCSRASKTDEPTAPVKPAKPVSASVDSTPAEPPPPPAPAPVALGDAAPAGDPASQEAPPSLKQVREALGQWTFQHNNPPKDLNDLVKEGYLKRLPAPPAGKRFVFDPRTMSVALAD